MFYVECMQESTIKWVGASEGYPAGRIIEVPPYLQPILGSDTKMICRDLKTIRGVIGRIKKYWLATNRMNFHNVQEIWIHRVGRVLDDTNEKTVVARLKRGRDF